MKRIDGKSTYDVILEYMENHNGRATIWEIQSPEVARTTCGHKYMQILKDRGLIRSDKAPDGSYHIYTLIDKQLSLGV